MTSRKQLYLIFCGVKWTLGTFSNHKFVSGARPIKRMRDTRVNTTVKWTATLDSKPRTPPFYFCFYLQFCSTNSSCASQFITEQSPNISQVTSSYLAYISNNVKWCVYHISNPHLDYLYILMNIYSLHRRQNNFYCCTIMILFLTLSFPRLWNFFDAGAFSLPNDMHTNTP